MKIIIRLIFLFLYLFVNFVVLLPRRAIHLLRDHCQWYRRHQGGVWLGWNGYWEQVQPGKDFVIFYRGQYEFDLGDGTWKWSYREYINLTDTVQTKKIEDYTKTA